MARLKKWVLSGGGGLSAAPPLLNDACVQAAHLTELRQAVNAIRAAAGLAPASFTDPVVPLPIP